MDNSIHKMDNSYVIINYLGKNLHKSFSMYGLSKKLKIPYATFYRTIKKIGDIISSERIGQTKAITLNKNSEVLEAYLVISSVEEEKKFLEEKPIFKLIKKEIQNKDVVLLFGSYAKRTERKESDIDIMVINKKGDRSISFASPELLMEKQINPMFFTEKEFKLMLKDKEENVGKQALKGHIVLNNAKRFWELVLDEI